MKGGRLYWKDEMKGRLVQEMSLLLYDELLNILKSLRKPLRCSLVKVLYLLKE